MDKNSNSLNWFEIPALDITRAIKFYEAVFTMKMADMAFFIDSEGNKMALHGQQ